MRPDPEVVAKPRRRQFTAEYRNDGNRELLRHSCVGGVGGSVTNSMTLELDALTAEDFVRILTEPDASLTEQYAALMATEELKLEFTEDGVRRVAEIAFEANERTENIGARRLHTVMERLLEEVESDECRQPDESGVHPERQRDGQQDHEAGKSRDGSFE